MTRSSLMASAFQYWGKRSRVMWSWGTRSLKVNGPGADGFEAEILAGGLGGLGGDDHAGAVGELGDEGRGGGLEDDLDGEGVDDVDVVHRVDLGAAEAALHREVAFEGVFDGGGVHLLAVVEEDAGAELDEELGRGGPFVGEGELGDGLQLFVDVEELVAEAGEYDAADVGAGEGGVEDVGVFAEGDAEGLGRSRGGCGEEGQGQGCEV